MTEREKKHLQEIHDYYRKEFGRPDLTAEQIEELRAPIRKIAEATLNYLTRVVEK